jgi:hypothetical protein
MAKININEASAAQLRGFAEVHLGAPIAANASAAKARAIIDAIKPGLEEIEVVDTALVASAPAATKQDAAADADYVTVIIAVQEGPGGDRPIPLGCNGPIMLVERGKESRIPRRFFESLKNAQKFDYKQDKETREMIKREVPLYPYTVVSIG